MTHYYLARWEWITESGDLGDSSSWAAPLHDKLLGLIDLRSRPQMAMRETARGFGFFAYSEEVTIPDSIYVGSALEEVMPEAVKQAVRDAIEGEYGWSVSIDGERVVDVLAELVTSDSDPAGESFARTLLSERIHLAGHVWRGEIARNRAWKNKAVEALRHEYGRIKAQARGHRKTLGFWDKKWKRRGISAADITEDRPLPPETTITDDFTRSDSADLGSSSEGWSWTEVRSSGDFAISSNRADQIASAGADDHQSARAETDLSGDDHYVQVDIPVGSTGSNRRAGPCARFDSSSNSFYAFASLAGTAYSLVKVVSGTRTQLATGTATPSFPATLKIEVDGSDLEGFVDGVSDATVTDTSFTGQTRTGFFAIAGGDEFEFDNFEASDLVEPGPRKLSQILVYAPSSPDGSIPTNVNGDNDLLAAKVVKAPEFTYELNQPFEATLEIAGPSDWGIRGPLTKRHVLHFIYDDGTRKGARIRRLIKRDTEQWMTVEAVELLRDLTTTQMYRTLSPSDSVSTSVFLSRQTTSNVLGEILSSTWNAPSHFQVGTIDSVFTSETPQVAGEGITHWEAIEILREALGCEVSMSWNSGASKWDVNLVEEVGGGTASDRPIHSPTGGQASSRANRVSLSVTTEDTDYFSRIIPTAGEPPVGIQWATFEVDSITVLGGSSERLFLLGNPILISDQMVGMYAHKQLGTDLEIVASTPASGGSLCSIDVDGTDFSVGDSVRFVLNSSGDNSPHIDDPVRGLGSGEKTLLRHFENVVPYINQFEDHLNGAGDMSSGSTDGSGNWIPNGMELVGSATSAEETQAQYVQHGTSSVKVTADIGDGIQTETMPWLFREELEVNAVWVRVIVTSGRVRLTTKVEGDTGSGGSGLAVFPDGDEQIEFTQLSPNEGAIVFNLGDDVDDPADINHRLLALEDGTVFHLDALTITISQEPQPYRVDMGPSALFREATRYLASNGSGDPAYEVNVYDPAHLDDTNEEIELGTYVELKGQFETSGGTFNLDTTGRVRKLEETDDPSTGRIQKKLEVAKPSPDFANRFKTTAPVPKTQKQPPNISRPSSAVFSRNVDMDPRGTNDSRAGLAALDAKDGHNVLSRGTYLINSDITLSSHTVFEPEAILKPASGQTITIPSIEADLSQHFDLSLGGTVAFTPGKTKGLFPQWWGASSASSQSENLSSIQAAIDAGGDDIPIVFVPGEVLDVGDAQLSFHEQGTYQNPHSQMGEYVIGNTGITSSYSGADGAFILDAGGLSNEEGFGPRFEGLSLIRTTYDGACFYLRQIKGGRWRDCNFLGGSDVVVLDAGEEGCWYNNFIDCQTFGNLDSANDLGSTRGVWIKGEKCNENKWLFGQIVRCKTNVQVDHGGHNQFIGVAIERAEDPTYVDDATTPPSALGVLINEGGVDPEDQTRYTEFIGCRFECNHDSVKHLVENHSDTTHIIGGQMNAASVGPFEKVNDSTGKITISGDLAAVGDPAPNQISRRLRTRGGVEIMGNGVFLDFLTVLGDGSGEHWERIIHNNDALNVQVWDGATTSGGENTLSTVLQLFHDRLVSLGKVQLGGSQGYGIFHGAGSPVGSVTARVALYVNTSPTTLEDSLWVKRSTGNNNTDWEPLFNTTESVTFAASIQPDVRVAKTKLITLTGNTTIESPLGGGQGKRLRFVFTQDGTGGHTVSWHVNFKVLKWALRTGANEVSTIEFVNTDGTQWVQMGAGQKVADIGALTDNSGGTADDTIAAVGDTSASDQSGAINNNFADLAAQINELRTNMQDSDEMV